MNNSKRWMVAAVSVLVMLGPGAVYAFSLISQPLIAAFGWTVGQASWAFALANFFLGIGAVIGGYWADRSGPRGPALAGVVLWGVGNALAGITTPILGTLGMYLSYGVVGGLGCGMAY
ncbi:MAG: MFS transporter, partial [Candidatus Dormibacteria bacterium]